jgi:surfactin synthase thioesterase subunit
MKYETLVEDIIDSLDASVFNGDLFFIQENREDLRNWMSRWEQQLKEYDEII